MLYDNSGSDSSDDNIANEMNVTPSNVWVFGYGSLCWNPGFEFSKCVTGYVRGYVRRFWQGNTTHRGTVEKVIIRFVWLIDRVIQQWTTIRKKKFIHTKFYSAFAEVFLFHLSMNFFRFFFSLKKLILASIINAKASLQPKGIFLFLHQQLFSTKRFW